MRVHTGMINTNSKKEIRVWINENVLRSDARYVAENEEQMLADIVKVVMEFDEQTGSLMVNCYTLNEAINRILQSISETKSAISFSCRTNRKEDNQKLYEKKTSLGSNKTNVRSTKETEDDHLKPFNDSSKQILNVKVQLDSQ
jgi:hypothetical protein